MAEEADLLSRVCQEARVRAQEVVVVVVVVVGAAVLVLPGDGHDQPPDFSDRATQGRYLYAPPLREAQSRVLASLEVHPSEARRVV